MPAAKPAIKPAINKDEFVIGVDIGGTKVAAGIVTADGEIRDQARIPMIANDDATAGFAAVKSAIDSLFASASNATIRAIGVCAPGPLDPNTGVVINPPNLPCWRNFPLAAELMKIYSVPVMIDNDANAAALAEAQWGAGRGYRNVFYASIGTGIGTGIVFDGRIYHGRTGAAAEGGHVSIDYRGPIANAANRAVLKFWLQAQPSRREHKQSFLPWLPDQILDQPCWI